MTIVTEFKLVLILETERCSASTFVNKTLSSTRLKSVRLNSGASNNTAFHKRLDLNASHERRKKMMQDRESSFGWDPKSSKRSSGLFSVLKWFGNKESVSAPTPDLVHSNSSSCDSIESVFSTDTVASFAFVPPNSYKPFGTALQPEKYFLSGPETSTYRARLAQREARRETDRNLTLRSKYNLYKGPEPDRGHSLPLMTKTSVADQSGMHRRTASESSKHRRSAAYCHVKGKRRAPQPPGFKGEGTLRRRKRLAPQPPANPDVISNDSLKLDHGILKPAKEQETTTSKADKLQEMMQVSPRPWYKRTLSKSSAPEKKPDNEKRKSGLSFLTNISELDREAMEIVSKENLKMKYLKNTNQAPAFMRPKGNEHVRTNSDSWLSPKRKSAKDLIAKFNAITGVSRVSINLASRESAKEQSPQIKEATPETKEPENNARSCFQPEKKETKTTAVVKPISRSQWNCPKCTVENDYWRIICRVCSTIKPYFDDFTSISTASSPLTETKTSKQEQKIDKKDDLFGLASTEFRISELQRTVFQSHYPKLSLNPDLQTDDEKNSSEIMQKDFTKLQPTKLSSDRNNQESNLTNNVLKTPEISNFFQIQNPKVNQNSKMSYSQTENIRLDDKQQKEIEKMILGDELMFHKPEQKPEILDPNPRGKSKVEKIILGDELSVEKPDYVNVNKYEKIEVDKHEKSPNKSECTRNKNEPNLKIVENDEEKKNSAKKEEREKLKRMLIEMKNSLPKRTTKQSNESKHRVSLIKEQNEPEAEEITSPQDQEEKTAEIIVATTETVYENIKVKHENVEKPVKVSSSAQTKAVLKRNLPGSETGFHLIGAKDFMGISNEQTNSNHTYANIKEAIPADTLEINRLLRRLETAIADGQIGQAAVLARDLAELKLPLSVVRHKNPAGDGATGSNTAQTLNVDMYVEDKISHRGPFPLQVTETMTVAELKTLVDEQYKIPRGVQRWILGKQLAADDNATLASHQITTSGCPMFLYLVAPTEEVKPDDATVEIVELNEQEPRKPIPTNIVYNIPIAVIEEAEESEESENEELPAESSTTNEQQLWRCEACTLLNHADRSQCDACGLLAPKHTSHTYLQLVNLDNEDLVRNVEAFECLVCLLECPPGEGVTLRECLHQFCKTCLANTIEFSEEAEVKCPYRDTQYSCDIALQDREVKALVSVAVYEQHLAKSVKQAENKMDNTFHCKTPDCKGWCIYEDNVNEFQCPVCQKINCLTCQAIHSSMNCKQYQELMKSQSETDEDARRTRDFLEDMIKRGEALACPTCQVVLLKKWGCDWLRCSMCKTEICWVTRGPRWGPGGKGDTSGGCKCGVNGAKCHPKCNYCH